MSGGTRTSPGGTLTLLLSVFLVLAIFSSSWCGTRPVCLHSTLGAPEDQESSPAGGRVSVKDSISAASSRGIMLNEHAPCAERVRSWHDFSGYFDPPAEPGRYRRILLPPPPFRFGKEELVKLLLNSSGDDQAGPQSSGGHDLPLVVDADFERRFFPGFSVDSDFFPRILSALPPGGLYAFQIKSAEGIRVVERLSELLNWEAAGAPPKSGREDPRIQTLACWRCGGCVVERKWEGWRKIFEAVGGEGRAGGRYSKP